ncbi:Stf0 family sulfotransferase [Streptomyces sp. NPDC046862]|uniref:Stf0 family sulfotransferase n=1 Tax=Streptomyces sp. NPDC046862 TaxID=3154603 RepID=UPI003453581C
MSSNIGYLVLGSPRTGTNLLCHALRVSGQAGDPDEWYGLSRLHRTLRDWDLAHPESRPDAPQATDWAAYQQRLLEKTGSGGRFGVKVFYYHVERLFRTKQISSPVELLPEGHRADVRVILVARRDVVGQAVSMAIASRSGIFADVPGERFVPTATKVAWWREGPPPALVRDTDELTADAFDAAEIHQIVTAVRRHQDVWEQWLDSTRLPRVRVTYEDIVNRREDTLQAVFDVLGMPDRASEYTNPGLRRQATSLNQEIAERYREWLRGNPHAVDDARDL